MRAAPRAPSAWVWGPEIDRGVGQLTSKLSEGGAGGRVRGRGRGVRGRWGERSEREVGGEE